MEDIVIILGSSRSNGNTFKICQHLQIKYQIDVLDLLSLNINPFDYQNKFKSDDFLPTIQTVISNYQTIVFASPVYWYSMSGIMKNFIDRLSDLLIFNKDLGRKLRGKNMAVISCSGDDDVDQSFYRPFELSAEYLGMPYLSHMHGVIEEEIITPITQERIISFVKRLHAVK